MVTIYPKKVKHTTYDRVISQTGYGGRGYGTQKLYNENNILKQNGYASWGHDVKNASRTSGNDPKAIATPSGTRRQPEEIILTSWDTSSIPTEAEIKEVKVEVRYFTEGYANYSNTPGYFPSETVIKLKNNSKSQTKKIHGPTKNNAQYSATFSSLKLTPSELKNSQISIQVGENEQYGVVCKVKIQYVRMVVTYVNPKPSFKLTWTQSPNETKKKTTESYKLNIKNNNTHFKKTTCYIRIPQDATVTGLTYHSKSGSNNIYKYNITKNEHNISFTASYSTLGKKTISGDLAAYAENNPSTTTIVKEPQAILKFTPIIRSKANEIVSTYTFFEGVNKVQFKIDLDLDMPLNAGQTEKTVIDTAGLITEWDNSGGVYNGDGVWTFTSHPLHLITPFVNLDDAGTFHVSASYSNTETNPPKPQEYSIVVQSTPLEKNYFKIKLEDGSDVQYNSLSFSQGDDLQIPLQYTTEDYTPVKAEDFIIKGETKRIPLDEAEYIEFSIELTKEQTLEDVLAYIECYDNEGDCSDIILGIDNNGTLFDAGEKKYCLIKKISSSEPTILKLVVQSDTERNATIRLRPYNYNLYDSGKWTPGEAIFKDSPNVKIHIEGDKNDIMPGDTIKLEYCVNNKSDIDGKDLKYKLIEPNNFDSREIGSIQEDYEYAHFNKNSRILSFDMLKGEPNNREHVLVIEYTAKKKGVYDFIFETLDNKNTTEDNQHKNSCSYQVMVGIISQVDINTKVSNSKPEVNQLIDYTIHFKNHLKAQKKFYFDIYDVGNYQQGHNTHYNIAFFKTNKGNFIPRNELENPDDSIIGRWELTDIPVNGEYELTLSLKPQQTGLHTIQTIFINPQEANNKQIKNEQIFTDKVQVLHEKKQLEFNVYHAVNDDDISCTDITSENYEELLDIICDNDFINLSDSIYYIIEVINNDSLQLSDSINIYARLPDSFLEDKESYCSSPIKPIKDETTNLLNYQINSIEGCGKALIFLKVKPSQVGEFVSNFTLSAKTANVLHKKLILTVDTEFNQRELEHEITIYNFDKTNKYYRYEIDNQGEIFKFFNTGDKTLRPIETEDYKVSSVEKYTGTNLKEIVNDIKEHSKYVDPVFLRTGNNKLADKGYELYPDGLIRRFGLLKSEIFHYTNQLPQTSDLIEKTMRWDVDEWNTKMWAGGIYDNGVFDLTIDYDKVPSNFNILEVEHPIKNLQAIVDKTKPYGTRGICYYGATTNINFGIDIKDIKMQLGYNTELALKLNDIYLLTLFNRQDKTLVYHHDDIKLDMNLAHKINWKYSKSAKEEDTLSTSFNVGVDDVVVYKTYANKTYIKDSLDIVDNLYYRNNNTSNIDITIPYISFTPLNNGNDTPVSDNYSIVHYINKNKKELIGLTIHHGLDKIKLGYKEDEDFKGFILKMNNEEINRRFIYEDVDEFTVMAQRIFDGDIIIHFWVSTNKQDYCHIGYVNFTNNTSSDTEVNGVVNTTIDISTTLKKTYDVEDDVVYGMYNNEMPITFKISDQVKKINTKFDSIKENDNKWKNIENINNHGYALIEYNSKVDKECDKKPPFKVPILTTKYDNLPLTKLDEVIDIDFKITAQSNKNNFIDDININLLKDGDYHYPSNNIARKIYYPETISNTQRTMFNKYLITQSNISMCEDCHKTSLGYIDECPYCNSNNISHHKDVTPVTICNSCNWVTQGTHTYCHHCLSKDIINTDVDYNKTYCYTCQSLWDDYYHYCPKCLSDDVVYLDNKKTPYTLNKKDTIDPIHIKTIQNDIDIFSIEIPFGKDSEILKELNKLDLNINCTNNNKGTYYYCEDCQVGGLGNYTECPNCKSTNIVNKKIQDNILQAYILISGGIKKIDLLPNNILQTGTYNIDLLSLSEQSISDSFTIIFNVYNANIDNNIKEILSLPIDEKYINNILDSINTFDFTIDSIYVDYDLIDTSNKWNGIDNLTGENHTGITYKSNTIKSESLILNDFCIPENEFSHAYFYIAGICKSESNFTINLTITDSNYHVYNKTIPNINDTLFSEEIDLVDIIGGALQDIKIEVDFEYADEIIITDCNILTEEETDESHNELMNNVNIEHEVDGDSIIFKSDNIWGLKKENPGYVSGRTLETNLLSYIDFGDLKSSEYIRVYDIEMIIYYLSKAGKITTESIPVLDETTIEQYISGDISAENGESWGFIQNEREDLNNLEYEKLNIDEYGNLTNSIPLNKKIMQSFKYSQSDISKINLEYFGKKGYPSDIISICLYDDYNGQPDNLIAQNKIKMPKQKEIINVDFDVGNLNDTNGIYWIVLEDTNADNNNYHRFHYNNENIGTLIVNGKNNITQSLCFSIQYPYKTPYYNLPLFWTADNDMEIDENGIPFYDTDYKMANILYRYNTNISNVYASKIIIRNGQNKKE